MKSSILVTGAAGFIGSKVAYELLQRGYRVVTIDNLSTGTVDNIPDGVEFIEGSVSDDSVIKRLKNERFQSILHIAGQSSGEISFEFPAYDLEANVCSTLKLLQYAVKNNIKNFVYASSMSVYGDHSENPLVFESSDTKPKSFYAVGKLASENYLRIYANQYGLNCVALRFFNVYGIGQNLENLKQGMASIFLAMAINDHHIYVKGAKDRFRDFVYIDDVVRAVIEFSDWNKTPFEVFNICSGKPTTVENVINEICRSLPYPVTVEYGKGTPGDQHGIYGCFDKVKNVTGWEPKVQFPDGMKIMVKWALEKLHK